VRRTPTRCSPRTGSRPTSTLPVDAVLAVARCLADAPADVTEIEVNPLMAGPAGTGAVAVDALIVRGAPEGEVQSELG
jgi:hypothetical protein